jgi:hypothetical protein
MHELTEQHQSARPQALSSPATCWRCGATVAAADHYCRDCGGGQGAFLPWYYRPFWILVLALTALGPLVLPLVWRTPRLDRRAKWIASLAVIALTAYVVWEFVVAVRALTGLIGA